LLLASVASVLLPFQLEERSSRERVALDLRRSLFVSIDEAELGGGVVIFYWGGVMIESGDRERCISDREWMVDREVGIESGDRESENRER